MKREISPWVAVVVVLVVAAAVGLWMFKKSGPGAQAKEAEDRISASVMGAGGKTPPAGPPGMAIGGPAGSGDPAQAGVVRPGGPAPGAGPSGAKPTK